MNNNSNSNSNGNGNFSNLEEYNISNQPNTIFVGGINWRADENALKTYFNKFGPVKDCKIIMDKNTQKSKGYGFITFQNQETINSVKTSPNLLFMGKNMNIGEAVRKNNQHINNNYPNNKIHFNPSNVIYPDRSLEDSDEEFSSLNQSSPLLLSEQSTPILSSNINLNHHTTNTANIYNHDSQYYYSNYSHQHPMVGSYGYLYYDQASGSTYQIPFHYYNNPNHSSTTPIPISNVNSTYPNLNNSPHYTFNSPNQYVYQTYHYHIDHKAQQQQPPQQNPKSNVK